ncbi:MAG: alpha/beta hydrolase [Geminicoccaceae bacterium]|nr:MAG: alpha/beta hydrolase [Geminicoccaceae bacterium]
MIPLAARDWLGWLHPASGGRGVVLCPPWGFEALCVRRSFVELADALAAAGLPTLRLDLPGTGDALDPPPGTSLVGRWIEALLEAARLLRERSGAREVAFVGLRLGALLAAEAGGRTSGVACLALLAPPPSGRTYVRELRALARLAPGGPTDHGSAVGAEGIVAGGFALDAAALAELGRLDPLAARRPPAPRVLLFARPDGPPLAGALAAWVAAGARLEAEPFRGWSELMRDPLLATPPREAFARLVRFVAEGAPSAGRTSVALAPLPKEAVLVSEGFVERTLRFGPEKRLVGTLTEPSPPRVAAERPALLILNTGATPRCGPGRVAVDLARTLAADGIRSLRIDLGGLGDSGAEPGANGVDIYRRGALAEVRAALDLLADRGAGRVVATGVCSGAFMAFHAALGDPRIVGAVLVNLPRFAWRPFHPVVFLPTRTLLALLVRPTSWSEALAGRGELLPAARVLIERIGGKLAGALPAPLRRLATLVSTPGRSLRALVDRGVRLLFLYGADDPSSAARDRLVGLAREPRFAGKVEVRVVEGAGHTFSDPASRRLLSELLRRQLDALRREGPGNSAADPPLKESVRPSAATGPGPPREPATILSPAGEDAHRKQPGPPRSSALARRSEAYDWSGR